MVLQEVREISQEITAVPLLAYRSRKNRENQSG
jgi:hypothetical protein